MSSSDASPRLPRCFWCLRTFSRFASCSAITMKRVVDSLVFVCSTRTSVSCLATRSRMSEASFWLSPNCARIFSNIRLVPSPSFSSKLRSSSCMRCCSRTMPCVSCGVWRAHTTYARSAKIATRRAMMSHSIRSIVAFHRVGILCLSMGMNISGMDRPDNVDLKKRETLKVLAEAGGVLAVTVAVPGVVAAADYLGSKKNANEQLQNEMHALRMYQLHDTNGVLEANFNEYRKIVRQESDAIRLKDADDADGKKGPDPADYKPKRMEIESRRDFDLRNFDKILIPKLLVLYVKHDTNKSLVEAYKGLFENVDERTQAINKIKKDGENGIDTARIAKIHSKLEYFPDMNSAEAKRSPLSFFAEK